MTGVHMQGILSDRPEGEACAKALACFLHPTWVSERLSGHLSKLQPNQAARHLPAKLGPLKLSGLRMLRRARGRPRWPPLRADAALMNLDVVM